MDKKHVKQFIGTHTVCQIGSSFRSQGYVPRGRVFIIGAHETPNGEWRLMALAKVGLDTWWIRDIRSTNSGWVGETLSRLDDEDMILANLALLYYGEGCALATGKDAVVLHPELVRKGMDLLPVHGWDYRRPPNVWTRMIRRIQRWLKDRRRPAYIQG